MRQLIVALTIVVVACSGCGAASKNTNDDGGAALPCACSAKTSSKRCVGNDVEACVEGQWRVVESCAASERCAAGVCRGPAVSGCPDEVRYEGGQTYRERYAPIAVSDCLPGGDIGRDASYHEKTSETRQRQLRFVGLSGCADPEAGLPNGSLSPVFGVDVTASINTTGYHQWEKREPIPPGEFGMFFRQTTRVERVATLWRQGQFLGLAVLTDWLFTPEFVTAPTCASLSSKAGPATTWPACHSAEEGCAPCSSTDR